MTDSCPPEQMITYSELWSIQEPILAMALALEAYLRFSGRIVLWKNVTGDWWVNLQALRWPNRHEISEKFLEIFILVYGGKAFSLRRIVAVSLSSLFLTLVSYFLFVRIGQTFFEIGDYILWISGFLGRNILGSEVPASIARHLDTFTVFLVIWNSLGINLFPDFVSVIETGWIIKLSTDRRQGIVTLALIDLTLTTLIWVVAHATAWVVTALYGGFNYKVFFLFMISQYGAQSPSLSAYIFTTYMTSILWFVFLFTVLAIAQLKRMSKIAVRILESRWVAELPIIIIVGNLCLLSWPILFLANLIYC